MSESTAREPIDDPLLRSSRREALVAVAAWAIATAYSAGYCWVYGYGRPIESLTFVLGFPDWIFWGLIVPWAACTVFSAWFGLFYMSDDPLDPPADPPK